MIKKSALPLSLLSLILVFLLSSCSLLHSGEGQINTGQETVKGEVGVSGELQAETEEENTYIDEIPEEKPFNVFIDEQVPLTLRLALFEDIMEDRSTVFSEREDADIIFIPAPYDENSGNSFYFAIVRDFFTLEDEINWQDFMSYWEGSSGSIFEKEEDDSEQHMYLKEEVLSALESVIGKCHSNNFVSLPDDEAVANMLKEDSDGFAIVPFEDIIKEYKVISIDGTDIFDKKLKSVEYPLVISAVQEFCGEKDKDTEVPKMDSQSFTNREIEKITMVNMTGVTALTRGTANRMDQHGNTYPGEKIVDILKDADITHISNEVSFVEDCSGYRKGSLLFCSRPEYMELIKFIGTDIVELTGNHLNDYGNEWFLYTLDYYEKEGLPYYGGGRDLESAHDPYIFWIGDDGFAFLGANSFGPASNWATEERAGSARINMWDDIQMEEDFQKIEKLIKDLKDQGLTVIFTFQYMETYDYMPVAAQIDDFRRVIDMGADIVSGSQAHQPQGMEFYNGGFINYGLGNLFFDQMQSLGTRQGIIAKHVFYDGTHISTILITTILEDYSQPRLTTREERIQLLEFLYSGSIY